MFLSPVTSARTRGDVLITGATGFLEMEPMARSLEDGDRRVWALVRASPATCGRPAPVLT
jgi:hypothetical protein